MQASPVSTNRPIASSVRGALLACLAVALFAVPVAATSVLALSTEELISGSGCIVHATCTGKDSFRDAKHRIVTRYSFRVAETLKGDAGTFLEFTQLGGSAGGYTYLVPGLSEYGVGDELVLFLTKAYGGQGELRLPVGLDQGIFRVERTATGEARVTRNLSGLNLVPRATDEAGDGGSNSTRAAGSESRDAQEGDEADLDTFLTDLRQRVKAEQREHDDLDDDQQRDD